MAAFKEFVSHKLMFLISEEKKWLLIWAFQMHISQQVIEDKVFFCNKPS